MKKILLLSLLFANVILAQSPLHFNKRTVECENQWVAFSSTKDSTYPFGFIYIDASAGLTFDYKGDFSITPDHRLVPQRLNDTMSIKYRLEPNQVLVAIIPDSQLAELHVPVQPEWLKFYQTDTGSVERLYRWGFLYNSWDLSAKALAYLQRAWAINPNFKGLAFEVGYAYNALREFDKAQPVLEKALQSDSNDCYLFKELSYAQMHLGNLAAAAETARKGIRTCTDKALKSEIAFNIAYQYYLARDKSGFSRWAEEVKKWAAPGDRFIQAISKLDVN